MGFAAQFSVVASVTLLVTPVVVAKASGRDDSYLVWMVFASLLVAGVSTLVQVRRVGPVGAGALLPMFTAAFSIPFAVMRVPHHDTGGLCPIHGRARSNAADAASTLSSSYLRPII